MLNPWWKHSGHSTRSDAMKSVAGNAASSNAMLTMTSSTNCGSSSRYVSNNRLGVGNSRPTSTMASGNSTSGVSLPGLGTTPMIIGCTTGGGGTAGTATTGNSGKLAALGVYDNLPPPGVHVEFFTNERSLKERLQVYFIKNQRSSLRIRIFNLAIKLISCILYTVRVVLEEPDNVAGNGCSGCCLLVVNPNEGRLNDSDVDLSLSASSAAGSMFGPAAAAAAVAAQASDACMPSSNVTVIDWTRIFFVDRDMLLWSIQVTVAIISLAETLLVTYLSYKGNILQQVLSPWFILEAVNTVPFIVTIFYVPLRNLFIPVFLNCWLAKVALENMLNDLHRAMQKSQSALAQQILILAATVVCIVFTSVCGIQHLQRGGKKQFSLFDSMWFVIVTFSTVGYGDVCPDIWPSKLFMMILIGTAIIVLPSQFEQLAYTWMERQKMGGTYSNHRAQNEKHVVVVATTLQADTIMDFLNEFYAHPKLQRLSLLMRQAVRIVDDNVVISLVLPHVFLRTDYFVVLLSPSELDATMKLILQVPIWAARVIYIQGSALKDNDLSRCRMQDAEACFMIAARNYTDKTAADQHTILRSWAVKDFAPHCPQYVQIFRPESKIHVCFAEHVVCEDEFKYALLANNCLCPGVSTLMTLLLHTSRGTEGHDSDDEWMRLYGRCSGNEIYHITLGESQFFGEYKGKSFTYASFHAHRKYGVTLVGIKQDIPGASIQLNPGSRHIMKPTDICFYMSITKEENSQFILAHPNEDKSSDLGIFTRHGSIKALARVGSYRYSKVTSIVATVGADGEKPCTQRCAQASNADASPSKASGGGGLGKGHTSLAVPESKSAGNDSRRPSISPIAAGDEVHADDTSLPATNVPSASSSVAAPLHGVEGVTMASEEESVSDLDASPPGLDEKLSDTDSAGYVCGFPSVTPYIGTHPTLCYMVKVKRPLCCLQLAQACEHCQHKRAQEYLWNARSIIIAADYASNGLYNFIVPLRSHARPKNALNPIVLLLEKKPDLTFLETICYFPMVYWMIGSIENLDDLLLAGINFADNIVIVNKESSNAGEEDTLADCNTIVAVQTIFRLFPNSNIITELSQASNMRFMQFRAKDHYALQLSKLEKKEKERGSHIYYMFRLPFASGCVFSASMLDTLLYQAYVKDYMITFVRLLLGVDQAPDSGHLACMKISADDLWIRTYGRLYQKLGSTTCDIPIGIYRTQSQSSRPQGPSSIVIVNEDDGYVDAEMNERREMEMMIKSRMSSLDLPLSEYDSSSDKRDTVSYVIINPRYDLELEENDIVYLIRPNSLSPQLSRLMNETHRKRTRRKRPHAQLRYADSCGPPGNSSSAAVATNSKQQPNSPGHNSAAGHENVME